jgi:large exoprotein involved in heme utilization and adhesion
VLASAVTVQTPGLYTVTANIQLTNADVSNGDSLSVWLRVNGVDAAATTNTAFVPAQVGGVAGRGLLTVSFTRQFILGDYFELYGLSKLGYAQIATTPASLSPAYPAAPGTTLTVAQIR